PLRSSLFPYTTLFRSLALMWLLPLLFQQLCPGVNRNHSRSVLKLILAACNGYHRDDQCGGGIAQDRSSCFVATVIVLSTRGGFDGTRHQLPGPRYGSVG